MPHGVLNQDGDFSGKACLVAGGNMVEAPNSLTYACVVSRESIRIALTLVTCFYQKLRLCSCGT